MIEHISIPCTYENDLLTIKALGICASADKLDEAYLQAISGFKEYLYTALCIGEVKKSTDSLKRTFYSVIVPYDQVIITKILELEPLPSEKPKKKNNSNLIAATNEEVVKLGF